MEKIDDSKKNLPVTEKQKEIIEQILSDYPDTKEMHEYEDYLASPTIGTASEFISRAVEDNAESFLSKKTYADYIATRPRAQRFGSHGLFTDDGTEIELTNVSEDLNTHRGNVWTAIVSLRREDGERLGFDDGIRWRDMLRGHRDELAKNLKISPEHLRWFAAFHNESYHPHVHMILYSTVENEGFLTKQGVNNLRSAFAKDIFAQDLLNEYEQQTAHRDELRSQSKALIKDIVASINSGVYDNPEVEKLLMTLADRLSKTKGKKVYGYLKADVKAIVDSVVDELAKDERIAELYDLWYQRRENIIKTYTKEMPPREPLSKNSEFKPIRNAVIQSAMDIFLESITEDSQLDEVKGDELPAPDPRDIDIEKDSSPPPITDFERTKRRAESGNKWEQYNIAKEYLDRESVNYNPQEAIKWLVETAQQGYTVAQYKLGKLFLSGEDVPKNPMYALRWLEEAVDQGNSYAEYLLGRTLLRGEDLEKDLTRAEELLRASADKGNRYAAYTLGKAYLDGTEYQLNIPEALKYLQESAERGMPNAQYILGKLHLKGEHMPKDIGEAIRLFRLAASSENSYAEYQLGKLYLYGNEVERDYDTAIRYLESSASHGNPYAEQLLHTVKNNRNWTAALGSLRLIQHLARLIQNRLEGERRENNGIAIDRKLRRQIAEKKEAHGIRQ